MLHKVICFGCLSFLLIGCGGATTSSPPQPIQPQPIQPQPIQPTRPESADYRRDGFSFNYGEGLTIVGIIEQDSNGRPQNYRASSGTDLRVVFRPGQNLTVVSQGQLNDGTNDREAGTLQRKLDGLYGNVYENQARIITQRDSYLGTFRIDENDGKYRHQSAFAGGRIVDPPSTGGGNFEGVLLGDYEVFDDNGAFVGDSVVAEANINVIFSTGLMTISFEDASEGFTLGGNGAVSGGQYQGFVAGAINVDGRAVAMVATVNGAFAGNGASETFGTALGRMEDNSGRQGLFTGAFVAAR